MKGMEKTIIQVHRLRDIKGNVLERGAVDSETNGMAMADGQNKVTGCIPWVLSNRGGNDTKMITQKMCQGKQFS